MLYNLDWKLALNGEKIEHDMQKSNLDNQVEEAVVGDSQAIKKESRIKEEKIEAEEEQRWKKEGKGLAREAFRNIKDKE